MCETLDKQVGSYTKSTTTFHSKRLSKLCRDGKHFKYVLAQNYKNLKPIYNLSRKGRLVKPPVLHMPNKTGRFYLYSNTSKFATGSALYEIQNGKPRLIAYMRKRLPEATRSYSITELELCGLAINIASFSHLLKKVDFDAIVDHLGLMHIIKSKVEPITTRINRLLEISALIPLIYITSKGRIRF